MNAHYKPAHLKLVIAIAVLATVPQHSVTSAFEGPNPDAAKPSQNSTISNSHGIVSESSGQATETSNELAVPTRANSSVSSESSTSNNGKSPLMDVGLKLGIVVGVFLIVMILISKKSDSSMIPKEAIEVLGRVPFASQQALQLVRFGQKLVLVESSGNGLKPISEMTDPAEVAQMLDMIKTKRR